MKHLFGFLSLLSSFCATAQKTSSLAANEWVDSVFKKLSNEQKIAQLMVVRLSAIDANTKKINFYDAQVEAYIRKYNIGGVCLFQGGPIQQANIVNRLQNAAVTPLLICIDGENGLGMRMDSVIPLPRQMMLGAIQDPSIVYQYGKLVGAQCKRAGIQVNYAPVVDVNNNPANPVINDRSFGENKYRVATLAIQYMKGMQDVGVMGCAKHFPGHGDVAIDSHKDLPVINKTRAQLDSLELYPFREIFKAGVGSVMVAHLYIPAIDKIANRATSISYKAITKLMREELGYQGITFTDALEMKGVAKFFPDGEIAAQSIVAGNDMLCLPSDIPGSIKKIKEAIKNKKIRWQDIDLRVKKVLMAKYQYGLANRKPIDLFNITEDLNSGIKSMKKIVAENALTLLRNNETGLIPLSNAAEKRIAYIAIGTRKETVFGRKLREYYNAHVYNFDYKSSESKVNSLLELLKDEYDVIITGIHNYARYPANNFGISKQAVSLVQRIQQEFKSVHFVFGNPYALKNFCSAKNIVACYDDDEVTQQTAADLLLGRFTAKGKLPVAACDYFLSGSGITTNRILPFGEAATVGLNAGKLQQIDSIVADAIKKKAFPGAAVSIAKNGKVVFEKAYGFVTYDSTRPVYCETIYDVASVTKIMATTLAVMKLYENGQLDLEKTIGDYLPWTKNSNKAGLKLKDLLLHQAGLKPFIPFYKETVDTLRNNVAQGAYYTFKQDSLYNIRVADNFYMRSDWRDTMYQRILQSETGPLNKYLYSDNDFIFLGKIVEALSGTSLDNYVKENFYNKLGLSATGYLPLQRYPLQFIAPTENETGFRNQILQGNVHDPGAAMFGGVAGHAGLFSNVGDMAVLAQVLLNGGKLNDHFFLKKETIDYFTAYHSENSRRGLGFDKPEKDNATRREAYPCMSASPQTFGHTGFTGTCVWMDPVQNISFVFLSNRVYPDGGSNNKISQLNIRPKIMEVIYEAMR
jgi:beta-glucosidase-like glycosyl hydrolase/CubicO group peptidase (beta-lactamase class C family)